MKSTKKIVLTLGFIATSILYLYMLAVVDSENHTLRNAVKPFPIIFLLMLYSVESKVRDPLVICTFSLVIMADIISSTLSLFPLAVVVYGLSNLCLISMLFSRVVKKAKKEIPIHFALGVVLFLIIFIFVIQNKGTSFFPILFYGITISFLFTMALLNYKSRMVRANGIFLITVGIRIVSDSVYAIIILNKSYLMYDLISLALYLVSSYMYYKSFIIRENYLTSSWKNQ